MNKKKLYIIVAAAAILVLIFIINLISFKALILLKDDKYKLAKSVIIIINNSAVGFISKSSFENRDKLLKEINNKVTFSFSVISFIDIKRIEFFEEVKGASIISKKLLGKYKIVASGHHGILNIWQNENNLYGSVKFPQWANGVTEYLKEVSVRDNKISFTRSISTKNELKRIGADSYFIQSYSGIYSDSGMSIKGFYVNKGARFLWEAKK